LGIGDWGLGLGIGPNPQSTNPNPQSPNPNPQNAYLIYNVLKILDILRKIFKLFN